MPPPPPSPPPSTTSSREAPVLRLEHAVAERAGGRGPVRAVDDVSLTVSPGELVALMGPSGSGKSSIIHLASGLLGATSGVVEVVGQTRPLTDRRGWARARRRDIGMVQQRLDLMPGLSTLDNVALPLLIDRVGVRKAHAQARIALERVGLTELADAAPTDLSGGERQRVAIARATVGERRLVLADEPTAALDTVAAESIVELLSRLAAKGAGVLMATHDTRLAGWADRVIFLRDGRVRDATDAPSAASAGPRASR